METTMKTSYQHDYVHDDDENNISQNFEIIDIKEDLNSTPTTIKVVILFNPNNYQGCYQQTPNQEIYR